MTSIPRIRTSLLLLALVFAFAACGLFAATPAHAAEVDQASGAAPVEVPENPDVEASPVVRLGNADFTENAPLVAQASSSETQDMHRLYNPNSGEHFYTADTGESDYLASVGWNYEGIEWTAPKWSESPVFRLYSGTDHHYCMEVAERDGLLAAGWADEGIGWYSDDARGIPLYRQFNPNVDPAAATNNSGSHNYTTSQDEHNSLVAIGWIGEDIGWYGVDPQAAPPSNPTPAPEPSNSDSNSSAKPNTPDDSTTTSTGPANPPSPSTPSVTPASGSYLVAFEGGNANGSMASITIKCGVSYTLPKNTFTKPNFTFRGWSTTSSGSGVSYQDGATVKDLGAANATVKLYAQWTYNGDVNNNVYTLIFMENPPTGGAGESRTWTVEKGRSQSLGKAAFTRSGYVQTGWASIATGDPVYGATAEGKDFANPGYIRYLYAVWIPAKYANVKPANNQIAYAFEANGGSNSMTPQYITAGTTAKLKENAFTRSGYVFDGWNSKADGSGSSLSANTTITLPANSTSCGYVRILYAQWKKSGSSPTPLSQYTVNFSANGGSGSMSAQKMTVNASAQLSANAFTRSGYTFKSWNTKADGSGSSYANKATVKNLASANGSITLFAQWNVVAGEKTIGGNTYYVQSDGSYYKGWKQDNNNWKFYDTSTGVRATSKELNIAKLGTGSGPAGAAGYRYFDASGNLWAGWRQWTSGSTQYNKYYDINTGVRKQGGEFNITMYNKTIKDNAPGYRYFDASGNMLYGWVGRTENGVDIHKYFDVSNGKRYENGEYYVTMYDKTTKDANPGYRYFDTNGVLLKDQWAPNGYYYNAIGVRTRTTATDNSGMNMNEYLLAREIFDAYNDYRASKGLPRLVWWASCESNAWISVAHCAETGKLEHASQWRPASEMSIWDYKNGNNHWLDILAASTYKKTGTQAVNDWKNSEGHRKMMQCDSAVGAAVACYNFNGTWYYAIVYCFESGSGQSGT